MEYTVTVYARQVTFGKVDFWGWVLCSGNGLIIAESVKNYPRKQSAVRAASNLVNNWGNGCRVIVQD